MVLPINVGSATTMRRRRSAEPEDMTLSSALRSARLVTPGSMAAIPSCTTLS